MGTSSQPSEPHCPCEGLSQRRTSSGLGQGPWLPRYKVVLGDLQVSILGSLVSWLHVQCFPELEPSQLTTKEYPETNLTKVAFLLPSG